MSEESPESTFFSCGPASSKCVCKCPEGPCEHVWDGPTNTFEQGESATCSRCGADAIAHAMWVMP